MAQDTSFCPILGPYGNNIYVSSATYRKGETVFFCLRDNGRIPLFYGPDERPWLILDENDQIVFQPVSIQPTSQPNPSSVFFDSWDQRDAIGKKMQKGRYKVIFTNTIYTVRAVEFKITDKK